MSAPITITALSRFPVKSMQGETMTRAIIGPTGIIGDRAWGIIDVTTGFVLTARREPALLLATACYPTDADADDATPPTITLPDGSIAADDEALSVWLGRPVRLERASVERRSTYENVVDFENEDTSDWVGWQGPAGTFHDSTRTQLSIASTTAMRGWDPRRFRANVIVAMPTTADGGTPTPPPEFALVDSLVAVGASRVDVVKRIDRCVMTTRPQPGGIERDLEVLRTIRRDYGGDLGVGALVRDPGPVAVGDPVVPID